MRKILVVDDDADNRNLLQEVLQRWNCEVVLAEDGLDALSSLDLTFDLVLLDVNMPLMDGFEVALRIRQEPLFSDLPIIMVTAMADRRERLRAVEVGANDFVGKPIDLNELKLRTESQLRLKTTQDEIKRHREQLQKAIDQKTHALRQALTEMTDANRRAEQATLDTIYRLSLAAEFRDSITGTHIQRISRYCKVLAEGLSLPSDEVNLIFHSSPMHDVGKLGIPDSILLKPSSLDEDEISIMRQHTTIGMRILSQSSSELLQAGEVIAHSHHEKWDGSGYPRGLSDEGIPLWGRICAVADVFDALTNSRPYKKACSNEEALIILKEGQGSHFDPSILEIFFDRLPDISVIQQSYQ